jgi:hypothetical protein
LSLLASSPRDWRLEQGKIRRGSPSDPDCPITAVARMLVGMSVPASGGVNRAAHVLDLEGSLISQLVAASDDMEMADPLVRLCLLEACGLLPHKEGANFAFSVPTLVGVD